MVPGKLFVLEAGVSFQVFSGSTELLLERPLMGEVFERRAVLLNGNRLGFFGCVFCWTRIPRHSQGLWSTAEAKRPKRSIESLFLNEGAPLPLL